MAESKAENILKDIRQIQMQENTESLMRFQ